MFNAQKVKDGIIQWIRDYFEANGKDCCAVIGISGGKDSTIAAALCVEALGPDRVYGVLMPQGVQSDIHDSIKVVDFLKIKYCEINIKSSVDTLVEAIKGTGLVPNKQAMINIPARVRMTTLYAVSAIMNGRVTNTCNLSEDWVGYSTKFGDSAGDFSPMARLTVAEVKAVGRELGIPIDLIDKVPADGLSGLTDEDNLGFSYDVLDKYLRTGICDNTDLKAKIDKLHKINLHKLQLMPCYEYKIQG